IAVEALVKNSDGQIRYLSCAVIDIDYFRNVNSSYGHAVGDSVLVKIGKILSDNKIVRISDFAGRYGGEEFAVVFPETSEKNILTPLQKIFKEIGKTRFKADNDTTFNITVSIGVSEFYPSDESHEDMLKRADKALDFAKRNGRNQITVYSSAIAQDISFVKESKNQINYNLSSSFSIIDSIHRTIKKKIEKIKPELIDHAVMVTTELCENAIKYGVDISEREKMQYTCNLANDTIEIKVKNGLLDRSKFEKIKERIDTINAADDVYELYVNRLQELMSGINSDKSQLGLLRIVYEGKFNLDYDYSDNILTLIAVRHY
ncbi:MAG: diguanylate cyclase, partial [Spirochaetota bacterium]